MFNEIDNQLNKKTLDLINFCLGSGNWAPDLDKYPVIGFINALRTIKDFSDKWSYEEASNGMYLMLSKVSERLEGRNPPASEQDAKFFIDGFQEFYKESPNDHWIIVPLPNTDIDEILEFGNFVFLPRLLERNEKLKIIANLSKITIEEMNKRANHTENSRSSSFFNYTNLCYRVNHHTDWVEKQALDIINTIIAILRLSMYSDLLEEIETLRFSARMSRISEEPNNHLVINRVGNEFWYTHRPLWTNENNIGFLGNLNWLDSQKYQEKLNELISFFMSHNLFSKTFHRSALFFNRSILFQSGKKEMFEGLGLEILHLMIAAEGILLDREAEKRLRLAVLLSRLVDIQDDKRVNIFNAVRDIYNTRSDYVHSGEDVHLRYDDGTNIDASLNLVRRSIAKLIIQGPIFL
jgi:hypothetical protein